MARQQMAVIRARMDPDQAWPRQAVSILAWQRQAVSILVKITTHHLFPFDPAFPSGSNSSHAAHALPSRSLLVPLVSGDACLVDDDLGEAHDDGVPHYEIAVCGGGGVPHNEIVAGAGGEVDIR